MASGAWSPSNIFSKMVDSKINHKKFIINHTILLCQKVSV